MDFDTILKEIGEFGRFQQTNYLLICLPVLFSAANSLSYVFTAGIPNYRCTVPECDNANNPIYDQSWASYAVPGTTDSNGLFIPEQCIRFKRLNSSNSVNDVCTEDSFSHETEICNQWVYDNTERTIVQEWTITCPENKWKLALVGTMHFAGILAGTAVFGFLADRFGRKIMFICAIFIMAITGMGQGWANDYITFLIFAFLNAVGTSGVYPLAFILGVEMVGPGKRELTGIVLNYFYAIGEAAVGLAAWLSRDWVILQFIVSAPPIIFIFYYWLIPESVRWLLARKEHRKAELIILKAAKTNGVIISESILQTLDIQHSDIVDEANSANKVVVTGKPTVLHALKNLVLSKVLVIRCLILAYIWAANAFVYYGLSLNSTNLSGNKYLNFALVCLVEIPGYSLAWLAMNKIGRRKSLAGSLLLCAFTCALGGYIDQQLTWAVVVLFLIGKLGITASFGLIYVYSAELLPTVIRSCGMGILSTVARFGALVAPFVPLLDVYYKSLPLLLFAAVSAIGGIIAIPLPETLGYPLPDTVEEAESIGRKVQDKK